MPNPEIITEGTNLGVIKVHKEPELEPEHIRPELKGVRENYWYNHTLGTIIPYMVMMRLL